MNVIIGTRQDKGRWYSVELLPSLLGGFLVVQTWGSVSKPMSGSKRRLWPDLDHAQKAFSDIVKNKRHYFGDTTCEQDRMTASL